VALTVFDSLPATSVMVATGNGQQSCLVLTFPVAAGGAPSAYVQGFTKLDIAQGAVASFNTGQPDQSARGRAARRRRHRQRRAGGR